MAIPAPAKIELLTSVVRTGTTPEQQSAFRAMGQVSDAASVDALGRFAAELDAGRIDPSVQLDLLDAMRSTKAEPLLRRLDQMKVGRDLATISTAMPGALANGGSSFRGQQVALQHESAQCTRCHTIGQSKAEVGPSLMGVGTRLTRELIVQSLVDPSAKLAPGFGQVSVTLKNGQKLQGTLREETATAIAVEDATRGLQRVQVSDIASRTNGASAMPDMDLLLTPAQIRDVVAYLMTLK
jgi:putative heme-binding domain-containing protein